MSGRTIIIAPAGAKYAVRVVPVGPIDYDTAFPSYPAARSYAVGLCQMLGEARLDDLCERVRL